MVIAVPHLQLVWFLSCICRASTAIAFRMKLHCWVLLQTGGLPSPTKSTSTARGANVVLGGSGALACDTAMIGFQDVGWRVARFLPCSLGIGLFPRKKVPKQWVVFCCSNHGNKFKTLLAVFEGTELEGGCPLSSTSLLWAPLWSVLIWFGWLGACFVYRIIIRVWYTFLKTFRHSRTPFLSRWFSGFPRLVVHMLRI